MRPAKNRALSLRWILPAKRSPFLVKTSDGERSTRSDHRIRMPPNLSPSRSSLQSENAIHPSIRSHGRTPGFHSRKEASKVKAQDADQRIDRDLEFGLPLSRLWACQVPGSDARD